MLAKSSVTFSVDILNRISKANVDAITITVAQAMFSQFNFEANAQKRLHESLSTLKAFSSASTALWFGIGMKHIVRSLADTEQGACCVAMCACLSTSYDSFTGGNVLKELCNTSLAPSELSPALSQWAALFDVCAGAVAVSQFPRKVEGFTRILVAPEMRKVAFLPGAGPPHRIAAALLDLAKVSKGALQQVVLSGSIDCAWLAAVAEWLLSLHVEILDASGTCLYRSGYKAHMAPHPQVIILVGSNRESDGSLATALTHSRTHLIPHGRDLFAVPSRGDSIPFFKGRSTWSSILHDTFGDMFDRLLQPQIIGSFARYLCNDLMHYPDLAYITVDQAAGSSSEGASQRKEALIKYAVDRLPELRDLHQASDGVSDHMIIVENLGCDCAMCSKGHLVPYSRDGFCLLQIVRTIFVFLYTLSWLAIDESVAPSSSGLVWLYMRGINQPWPRGYADDNPYRMWTFRRGVNSILKLFTGHHSSAQPTSRRVSAVCGNGVCVYVPSLADPNSSLLEQLQFRVVPGHIEYQNRLCKSINDLIYQESSEGTQRTHGLSYHGIDRRTQQSKDLLKFVEIHGSAPTFQLLIQETRDLYSLNMAIVLSREGLVDQTNQTDFPSIGALELCWALKLRVQNNQSCIAQALDVSSLWYASTELETWSGRCSLLEMDKWTQKPSVLEPQMLVPEPEEWILVNFQRWAPDATTTAAPEYYFQYIRGSFQFLHGLLISKFTRFEDYTGKRIFFVPASTCLYCLSLSRMTGKEFEDHSGVLHLVLEDKFSHIELSVEPSRVQVTRKLGLAFQS